MTGKRGRLASCTCGSTNGDHSDAVVKVLEEESICYCHSLASTETTGVGQRSEVCTQAHHVQ